MTSSRRRPATVDAAGVGGFTFADATPPVRPAAPAGEGTTPDTGQVAVVREIEVAARVLQAVATRHTNKRAALTALVTAAREAGLSDRLIESVLVVSQLDDVEVAAVMGPA